MRHVGNIVASRIATVPAWILVLAAIISIQLGAAIATGLFATLGPDGTVAVRIILSALLLLLLVPGSTAQRWRALRLHWRWLLPYGLCIGVMNLFFYMSIARIPLGAAVAFEFIGPLGIAAFSSRRPQQLAWVALAAVGIFLLSPFSGTDLDPVGIAYALVAGTGWAFFIVLTGRVSKRVDGHGALVIGMCIAGFAMLPLAIPVLSEFTNAKLLVFALGVALLSTTLPFALEFSALKRLSARAYGVLVSLEPAAAVVVGALLLGDSLSVQSLLAIACVVVAAAGVTLTETDNAP